MENQEMVMAKSWKIIFQVCWNPEILNWNNTYSNYTDKYIPKSIVGPSGKIIKLDDSSM